MPVIQGFALLARGYIGQDWADEYEGVDQALLEFAADESAPDVTAAIAGFESLLTSAMSEQSLHDRWILELHSGYDPRDDGFTYREWFAHALEVLRAEAARHDG